jgi:3-hydroxymyristoyl/3-hydroxydecanoyl-(acyl carrier protein) dehydratase
MTAAPTTTDPVILNVERSSGRVDLDLRVPGSLFYLRGHFPDFPILPGVVQLDWAIRYGRTYFSIAGAVANTVQVKFRKPILPEQNLRLSLSYTPERRRLTFDCRDREEMFSSGQIDFTVS